LIFTRQGQSDINDAVKRATVFAVAALLLWAAGILAHATTITVADPNNGDTRNLDPVFNDQPLAGCGLFESFDSHSSGTTSRMDGY
jgi:hypothetical protein